MKQNEVTEMINKLHADGYAACIFTPEEIPVDVRVKDIEERMCERGWDVIQNGGY